MAENSFEWAGFYLFSHCFGLVPFVKSKNGKYVVSIKHSLYSLLILIIVGFLFFKSNLETAGVEIFLRGEKFLNFVFMLANLIGYPALIIIAYFFVIYRRSDICNTVNRIIDLNNVLLKLKPVEFKFRDRYGLIFYYLIGTTIALFHIGKSVTGNFQEIFMFAISLYEVQCNLAIDIYFSIFIFNMKTAYHRFYLCLIEKKKLKHLEYLKSLRGIHLECADLLESVMNCFSEIVTSAVVLDFVAITGGFYCFAKFSKESPACFLWSMAAFSRLLFKVVVFTKANKEVSQLSLIM